MVGHSASPRAPPATRLRWIPTETAIFGFSLTTLDLHRLNARGSNMLTVNSKLTVPGRKVPSRVPCRFIPPCGWRLLPPPPLLPPPAVDGTTARLATAVMTMAARIDATSSSDNPKSGSASWAFRSRNSVTALASVLSGRARVMMTRHRQCPLYLYNARGNFVFVSVYKDVLMVGR